MTEDTIALFLTWSVEKFNSPVSTLNTYLSSLKRAAMDNELEVTSGHIFTSHRIQCILQGVARTHVKGSSAGEANRSISSPFTVANFTSLSSLFFASPRGKKKLYTDILSLAVMGMGLGGAMRPGEYLITNEYQRHEAVLTFSAVSLLTTSPPSTITLTVPSLSFINHSLLRQSYVRKGMSVIGISIQLKCSKTDQTRKGTVIVIDTPICIHHIMEYLLICPSPLPSHSPFFLSENFTSLSALIATHSIRKILKYFHHPMSSYNDFSMKSLRSGAIQTLCDQNASEMTIAEKGRWTSGQTPRKYYIRTAK